MAGRDTPLARNLTPQGQPIKLEPRKALAEVQPAFDTARMKADIEWLAAPEREGRGAGSRGLDAAANYIAARFERLGLSPLTPGALWRRTLFPALQHDGREWRAGSGRNVIGVLRARTLSARPALSRRLGCTPGPRLARGPPCRGVRAREDRDCVSAGLEPAGSPRCRRRRPPAVSAVRWPGTRCGSRTRPASAARLGGRVARDHRGGRRSQRPPRAGVARQQAAVLAMIAGRALSYRSWDYLGWEYLWARRDERGARVVPACRFPISWRRETAPCRGAHGVHARPFRSGGLSLGTSRFDLPALPHGVSQSGECGATAPR